MGSPLFWLRDDPQLFVAFLIAVVVGITFHEFSHAAVATLRATTPPAPGAASRSTRSRTSTRSGPSP